MTDREELRKAIVQQCDIPGANVSGLCVHSDEIQNQFETNRVIPRSTTRCVSWRSFEKILYRWYIRCRGYNIEVSGADIQRKALELNEKLKVNPYFKACYCWVQNFRKRYYITDTYINRDFSTQTEVAEYAFKAVFRKYLQDAGYALENVYNVVYTPIMWKSVPERSSIFYHAKLTGNQEMCEDHVTALLCVNATGCHKLPVLIIGSVKKNKKLYNFNKNDSSTPYRSNTSAWMNSTTFNKWFRKHFLKSVRKRQRKNGRREKTLLMLGNVRTRHHLAELNRKDRLVVVKSFPYIVKPLVEPMNCGILASFKRKYQKNMMETLMPLPISNTKEEVIDLHKELNMWDCCRIVHEAWSNVENAVIKNAWDKLFKQEIICDMDARKRESDIFQAVKLLHSLPGCERCNEAEVSKWFEVNIIPDKVMTKCTDEVLRDYGYIINIPHQENIGTVDDEAGPSHS